MDDWCGSGSIRINEDTDGTTLTENRTARNSGRELEGYKQSRAGRQFGAKKKKSIFLMERCFFS